MYHLHHDLSNPHPFPCSVLTKVSTTRLHYHTSILPSSHTKNLPSENDANHSKHKSKHPDLLQTRFLPVPCNQGDGRFGRYSIASHCNLIHAPITSRSSGPLFCQASTPNSSDVVSCLLLQGPFRYITPSPSIYQPFISTDTYHVQPCLSTQYHHTCPPKPSHEIYRSLV